MPVELLLWEEAEQVPGSLCMEGWVCFFWQQRGTERDALPTKNQVMGDEEGPS